MSIQKSEIKLDVHGKPLNAYLASSSRGEPGVLVLPSWWGLKPFFKQVCDQLAAQGYTALAPDYYGGRIDTTIDEAKALQEEADIGDPLVDQHQAGRGQVEKLAQRVRARAGALPVGLGHQAVAVALGQLVGQFAPQRAVVRAELAAEDLVSLADHEADHRGGVPVAATVAALPVAEVPAHSLLPGIPVGALQPALEEGIRPVFSNSRALPTRS